VNLIDPWGLGPCPTGVPGECLADLPIVGRRPAPTGAPLAGYRTLGGVVAPGYGGVDQVSDVIVTAVRLDFVPPTNRPSPPPQGLRPGWSLRVMGPSAQYPNGYWRLRNSFGQYVDPSTMRPPGNVTTAQFQAQTHVPLPPGYFSRNMYTFPRLRGFIFIPYLHIQLQRLNCAYGQRVCDGSI